MGNGISEKSQRSIAEKIAEKFTGEFLSGKRATITSGQLAVELLKETGYPVDADDFRRLLIRTLCMVIEKYHKYMGE
jgi:hypothetical protein